MPSNPARFLASELPLRPAARCRFHIIPVPFEASVSYGSGTAHGPAAVLEASNQLEVLIGRRIPSEQGVFTHPAVDCSGGSAEAVLSRIEQAVHACFAAGPASQDGSSASARSPQPPADVLKEPSRPPLPMLPVLLGGEHTVTLGALRALKKQYGHFGIVQFDAHADLRAGYGGTPYSHACVMRRAVDDLSLALFQIGVRSLSPEEAAFRAERNIPHLDAREAMFPWGGNTPLPADLLPADFPELLFITFDIDAFDASLMPATGTPEPGGLFWWDALRLLEACLAGRRAVGFDVVELAPRAGLHAPEYTAARLVHEIMALV